MFAALSEIVTESDVEQKLLWPLLTVGAPSGFGYQAADVLTKPSIRRFEIGKGNSRRLYYPDYVVALAGLPVLVVEAKAPSESAVEALTEARLYANEINALFPSGVNPCIRVVTCNGSELVSSPVDSADPDVAITFGDWSAAHPAYGRLMDLCGAGALQLHVDGLRGQLRHCSYRRAVSLVGGAAFQNEELPPNTFGATIAGDYGHIFNPRTFDERAHIAKNAYVRSLRRQRHIEPIDRLIRSAVSPAVGMIPVLTDTAAPNEVTKALRERKRLENQIMLLVGSVGVGKSTFVDYLSLVALPDDIRAKTIWLRINLNEAPLSMEVAYAWLGRAIIGQFRQMFPETDFDHVDTLTKVFGPELSTFRRGPVALLDSSTDEFRIKLTEELLRLQRDHIEYAKAIARYACAGPGKLLVLVLDNCDKRTRDEQLFMFQVAHWVQNEFRALIVFPLRDVTFDRHRNEPPLDTAVKNLVFRIEPPPLTDVLQARVRLALEEMQAGQSPGDTLTYVLPNGMRVSYPASDQGLYLASMLGSLYAHDRFVKQVMTGLAGRDVRRALEIFLDFCTSGHIGEDEIYKIRFFQGKHTLPASAVARVLLRMHRRFYDGDRAYLKNLVQCVPDDALPDHFIRVAILQWLERYQQKQGPAGVRGFYAVDTVVQDLAQLGHDATAIRREVLYLVREGCVVAEHLRSDTLGGRDLVKVSAAGVVHLQLMANPDYLAACAEDTWLANSELAERVAARIGGADRRRQISPSTTARNAFEFVEYLRERSAERIAAPDAYLATVAAAELRVLREVEAGLAAAEVEVSRRLFVGNLHFDATEADVRAALAGVGVEVTSVSMPGSTVGRSNRGYAFIEVGDGKAAMRAMDLSEVLIRGREIAVSEAHPTRQSAPRRIREWQVPSSERVFVGNIGSDATGRGIEELFGGHGFRPVDVYLARDRVTRQPSGYGFVSLASRDEAERAIGALNGVSWHGRRLVVRVATPRGREVESVD